MPGCCWRWWIWWLYHFVIWHSHCPPLQLVFISVSYVTGVSICNVLFRFDQKRSFDRKKILFALALCILQQQLVILWWKFCSPNRFASDQWLHSKSPRNIYDQMTPLAEPDWHKRRPFAPGDAVFIEWNVDAFNAHILWSGGTGFQGIWALVTAFPKEHSTVLASSFQTGVDFPASAGVVVRGLPLNGDSCYAANQSCLPFLIILAI